MEKLIYLLLFVFHFNLHSQDITGQWNGSVQLGENEMVFVFHLEKNGEAYSSTMDIPTRGVQGVKTKATTFKNDSLHIDGTSFGFEYKGKFNEENSQFEGRFYEGIQSVPLNLTRQDIELAPRKKRPQEPEAPYPYKEEEVSFSNKRDGINLAGTLTMPKGEGKFPAVILVTGSGPQNRDQEIYGHKSFWVLADYLTRQGIAVLRYDDRGVNGSTGNYTEATTADFAEDARNAVEFIKTRAEIDTRHIGIIGHSEGGIIAPMVANQTSDVSFIVSLAGTGVSGADLSTRQAITLRGFPVADEAAYEVYVRKAIDIARADKAVDEVRKELKDYYLNSDFIQTMVPEADREKVVSDLVTARTTHWLRYFYNYNPADEYEKLQIPVFSLNGSNDLQVEAKMNQEGIRKALERAGNEDFLIKEYPKLNHMFQKSTTGQISEYKTIEQTISPEVLNDVAQWILVHVK